MKHASLLAAMLTAAMLATSGCHADSTPTDSQHQQGKTAMTQSITELVKKIP